MVDQIAVKVLLRFENILSGSAVVTGNIVRMVSTVCTLGNTISLQSPKAPMVVLANGHVSLHCCFQILYSPLTIPKGLKSLCIFLSAAGKISCQVDSLTKLGRIIISEAIFC